MMARVHWRPVSPRVHHTPTLQVRLRAPQAISSFNVASMRMTLWYLELCMATAEGDVGRVFEIFKVQFRFNWIAVTADLCDDAI